MGLLPCVRLLRARHNLTDLFSSATELVTRDVRVAARRRHHNATVHQIALPNSKRPIKVSRGKLAKFSDGACVVSIDDTSVLVTAVCDSKSTNADNSFADLTVNFRLKSAASGRIPTTARRRDGAITDREVLISRVIDRSVRPLFPPDFARPTQLTCNVLANESISDVVIASINGASVSLMSADTVRWIGPVGACRVVYAKDSGFEVNPPRRAARDNLLAKKKQLLDMMIVGTEQGRAVMIEAEAAELSDALFVDAIACGLDSCSLIAKSIRDFSVIMRDESKPTASIEPSTASNDMRSTVRSLAEVRLRDVFADSTFDKISRDDAVRSIRTETWATIITESESETEEANSVDSKSQQAKYDSIFTNLVKGVMTSMALKEGKRVDGRSIDEVRPITCEVDLHKPLHGSSLFQRGQTQVMATATLDSLAMSAAASEVNPRRRPSIEQEEAGDSDKTFMLHYEFPGYATNEITRGSSFAGSSRREIGHGALAEKALNAIVPKPTSAGFDEMPFAVRVTCEVLESNGSSSMASVCAGSLALMDAGIQVVRPAAGVAMGLLTGDAVFNADLPDHSISQANGFVVLTDITGMEDYLGLMDFKLAGTASGVTAVQADVKLADGLTLEMIRETVTKGRTALTHILGVMADQAISQPRSERKDSWPAASSVVVPAHKRQKFVGPGQRNLRYLASEFGVHCFPTGDGQLGPDGNATPALETWSVFAPSAARLADAMATIDSLLTHEEASSSSTASVLSKLKFGDIIDVVVLEVRRAGLIVAVADTSVDPVFMPNSQLSVGRVVDAHALPHAVGDKLQVKYYGLDPSSGAVRLSRTALIVAEASAVSIAKKAAATASSIKQNS